MQDFNLNKIEYLFKDTVIRRGGIDFYNKDDALRFVEECKNREVDILGIDGFFLTEKTTQPSSENSIDYTSKSTQVDNIYASAKEFLESRDENLYFEIVYDEQNEGLY